MSASREKQVRRDNTSGVSPKTAREAKQRQEEQRSNFLYGLIAAALVIVTAASAVWNSNIIPRMAAAVSADGKNYTAAQVDFWYNITANTTIGRWDYMASYLGLDTSKSLDEQTISDSAAEMLETEAGITWKEYFLQRGIQQMVSAAKALEMAAEDGYQFSDSVQEEIDETIESLTTRAAASGVSLGQYLKATQGVGMTAGLYRAELRKYLQYQDYVQNYYDSMEYTPEELEAYYEENTGDYDLVAYQADYLRGTAASTTDDEGNPVEPTEEESAAAHEAAEAKAQEIYAAYQGGASLESLAGTDDSISYYSGTDTPRDELGTDLADWLYDADRKDGDSAVIPSGENFYVAVFQGRHRDENKTVDIRHILITPETGELSEGDEGYEEEQARLKEAAKAKAEEIYQQWKDGEATEESFGELARENTADSNGEQGGLYEKVYEGQMVQTFNDWCFDPARQSGDTGIVETEYGFHIMYYVGGNVPRWQAQVEADVKANDFEEWTKSLYADADITRHDFGMSFV